MSKAEPKKKKMAKLASFVSLETFKKRRWIEIQNPLDSVHKKVMLTVKRLWDVCYSYIGKIGKIASQSCNEMFLVDLQIKKYENQNRRGIRRRGGSNIGERGRSVPQWTPASVLPQEGVCKRDCIATAFPHTSTGGMGGRGMQLNHARQQGLAGGFLCAVGKNRKKETLSKLMILSKKNKSRRHKARLKKKRFGHMSEWC